MQALLHEDPWLDVVVPVLGSQLSVYLVEPPPTLTHEGSLVGAVLLVDDLDGTAEVCGSDDVLVGERVEGCRLRTVGRAVHLGQHVPADAIGQVFARRPLVLVRSEQLPIRTHLPVQQFLVERCRIWNIGPVPQLDERPQALLEWSSEEGLYRRAQPTADQDASRCQTE